MPPPCAWMAERRSEAHSTAWLECDEPLFVALLRARHDAHRSVLRKRGPGYASPLERSLPE
jgi:hypothetical protein